VRLRLRERRLEAEAGAPLIMGILNATPDSFSDPGERDPAELVDRGRELAAEGAAIVDVGGESGRTDTEAVPVSEEIARVEAVVEALASDGIAVSVDTWRAPVARAALDAGAAMINDVSGLSDPAIADACANAGAALVITHTRIPPKQKGFPDYDDVVADVRELFEERIAVVRERGVDAEQVVLDPGLDLAKTPAESIELIRRLPELADLGRPLLLAVSRKDFLGALTGRPPAQRGAGTLAAVGAAAAAGAHLVRVHDVAATRDYLEVRSALGGAGEVPPGLELAVELRREPA
jgi:dihydropteroate synthase